MQFVCIAGYFINFCFKFSFNNSEKHNNELNTYPDYNIIVRNVVLLVNAGRETSA